jgi:hypothetical protein
VEGASFVCSSREVSGLLEACVSRSSELVASKASPALDLEVESLCYLKQPLATLDRAGGGGGGKSRSPLAAHESEGELSASQGPFSAAVLSISVADLLERDDLDLIVSLSSLLSSPSP